MPFQSKKHLGRPASLARRHFIGVIAAGAGRLSAVAAASALLAGKSAHAMGLFPKDDPRGPRPNPPNHQCFMPGTLIRTPDGEIPVEALAVGDLVVTANGALPVRWVGRQTIRKNAASSWHPSVMPVLVRRFAIDGETPTRDLRLSQNHCLFVDGHLIPVKHLVNGRSIVIDDRVKATDTIEYVSVELDAHEVVHAEGLAAETFRYSGGEIAWDNLEDYEKLYGPAHRLMESFAPHCRYTGGRDEAEALLRLAASPLVDMRDPIQIAYARIAARAMASAA